MAVPVLCLCKLSHFTIYWIQVSYLLCDAIVSIFKMLLIAGKVFLSYHSVSVQGWVLSPCKCQCQAMGSQLCRTDILTMTHSHGNYISVTTENNRNQFSLSTQKATSAKTGYQATAQYLTYKATTLY